MDPASMPFSQHPDPLAHELHHHHSRPHQSHHQHRHQHQHQHQHQQSPPPQQFRIPTLPSHPSLDLAALDTTDSTIYEQHLHRLNTVPNLQLGHAEFAHHGSDGFDRDRLPPPHLLQQHHGHRNSASDVLPTSLHQHPVPPPAPPHPVPPHSAPPTHNQFGLLTHTIPLSQSGSIPQILTEEDALIASSQVPPSAPEPSDQRPHGQLVSKIVVDPPDLQSWREKLFNVDDKIVLTNDEFETYFPHIDNVYSHRSTQKYKRKPFVSHYWDCRMKGRPPGTPKSDDPAKKKRKRFARERDLCDVKIKITEFFPGASLTADGDEGCQSIRQAFPDGVPKLPNGQVSNEKYWTIQRVNGNGGNGKGDGVAGPHKHTLEKSDEIKKSTVQRHLAAQERESKKIQKPVQQKRPSGAAYHTAKKHTKDSELKLYAASFCPFSQRVWIALEVKGMQYQYCETDPFKRPQHLLEANPRGLVPAIREGDWASGESTVILEYLEDHDHRVPLLPTDPRLKANCRLWIDHINTKIVPAFYALTRAADVDRQIECDDRLQNELSALVQAADERGPYFLGGDLCLVDIHIAPFVLRMSRILRGLRNWGEPRPGTRWQLWADALEQNPHIQATTSSKELYIETLDLLLASRMLYEQ
ncbi:hypothetical protein F5Y15DRAFT_383073 [Xylariaceae sp. FL0016]|nr:hypothetical protein F5Y15DRAFT_383073 [Xylariaceae sp. FL0016]